MLTQLQISNFQSHSDTTLDFVPGVNVVVGASDSGKTAIIRALKWLFTNRPQGDSIKSFWAKDGETSVRLFLGDLSIGRSKGKEDIYTLGESAYKAFKTDVPEDIQKALNISDVNIAYQLDSPYLLSKSSGEVATHFNQIANLSKIDEGTNNINSSIREITASVKFKEGEEKKLSAELSSFEYLDEYEKDVIEAEGLQERLDKVKVSIKQLENIIYSYQDIDAKVDMLSPYLFMEKDVSEALELIGKKKELVTKRESLRMLMSNMHSTQEEIDKQKGLAELEPLIKEVLELHGILKEKRVTYNSLNSYISKIKNLNNAITIEKQRYETLHSEFEKDFPAVCPLCNK